MKEQRSIFKNKIALISDQHYPIDKADSEQTMNTVSALASEGVQVDLVIPKKWRKATKSNERLKADLMNYYQVTNGFRLSGLMHLPLSPLRIEKYSHSIVAPIYSKLADHDIIMTRNPATALVSLVLGKKVVFETYKLYEKKRLIIAELLAKLTHRNNLIGVITHSVPSQTSLVNAGAVENKIEVIHNGFNPRHLIPELTKREARNKLDWSVDEKIVCYTGRVQKDKGLESILQVAQLTPEIYFAFVGSSTKKDKLWLENRIKKLRLKNIRRYAWVPPGDLAKYLYAADALMIPPTDQPMLKYGKTVLPIKLFIYLAAGRPVIAPRLPDTSSVLNNSNAILVPPDDAMATAQAVREVFHRKAWASKLALQARDDSKRYTWQARAKKIIDFLNRQLKEYTDNQQEV